MTCSRYSPLNEEIVQKVGDLTRDARLMIPRIAARPLDYALIDVERELPGSRRFLSVNVLDIEINT